MAYNIYRNGQNTPFEKIFQSGTVYEPKYTGMMGFKLRSNRPIEYQNNVGYYDVYGRDIGTLYAGYYDEFYTSASNVSVPNGCTRVKVLMIGSAGGGGNGDPYSPSFNTFNGGSGGSGSFGYFEYVPLTYKYSVVIGLGGKASGNSSSNGQTSSFKEEADVSLGIGSRTNTYYGGGGGGTQSINGNNLGGSAGTVVFTFGENVGNYDGYTGNNGTDSYDYLDGAPARQSAYVVQQFDIGTYYLFYPSSLPLSGVSGKGGNNSGGIGEPGQNAYCRVYYYF